MVELDISEYCVVLGIYISVLRLKYRFIEFGFFFFCYCLVTIFRI